MLRHPVLEYYGGMNMNAGSPLHRGSDVHHSFRCVLFFFLKWRLCSIAKAAGNVSNNNSHAALDGLELKRAVKMVKIMEPWGTFSRAMWRF